MKNTLGFSCARQCLSQFCCLRIWPSAPIFLLAGARMILLMTNLHIMFWVIPVCRLTMCCCPPTCLRSKTSSCTLLMLTRSGFAPAFDSSVVAARLKGWYMLASTIFLLEPAFRSKCLAQERSRSSWTARVSVSLRTTTVPAMCSSIFQR